MISNREANKLLEALEKDKCEEAVILKHRIQKCERAKILAGPLGKVPERDLKLHLAAMKEGDYLLPVSLQLRVAERLASDSMGDLLAEHLTEDERLALVGELVEILAFWEFATAKSVEPFDSMRPKYKSIAAGVSDTLKTAHAVQDMSDDEDLATATARVESDASATWQACVASLCVVMGTVCLFLWWGWLGRLSCHRTVGVDMVCLIYLQRCSSSVFVVVLHVHLRSCLRNTGRSSVTR
jgi:hypothetical protein